jgi:hypothetical protein
MLCYEEIPSKIKAPRPPLGKRHAAADRKLAEREFGEWLIWKWKTSFHPASVLTDNRPAHPQQIHCQFFLCPTEAYAQTLIFVHDWNEL